MLQYDWAKPASYPTGELLYFPNTALPLARFSKAHEAACSVYKDKIVRHIRANRMTFFVVTGKGHHYCQRMLSH